MRQSNLLVRTACATRDMSPKIKKASERKNIWKLSHFARSKAGFWMFLRSQGVGDEEENLNNFTAIAQNERAERDSTFH